MGSWSLLSLPEQAFTIYGGTITNIAFSGTPADLSQGQSAQFIDVTFTTTGSDAILAWGGHIASRTDWGFFNGEPRSAGGISGSPYHMALVGWTLGNLGAQDRSLSAAAVVGPPTCEVAVSPASQEVCLGDNLNINVNNQGGTAPFTYVWTGPNGFYDSLTTNSTTEVITINSAQPNQAGIYTLTITDHNAQTCTANANIVVDSYPVCSITANSNNSCPGNTNTYTAPPGMSSYSWVIQGNGTISGLADQQTVTVINGSNCNNGSYTIFVTIDSASAPCTSTCSVPFNFGDNTPPSLTCASDIDLQCGQASDTAHTGHATATDDCDANPEVTYSDNAVAGCVDGSIDRTWTATDACGNQSTCVQHIRFVDTTPPQINCPSDYTIGGNSGNGQPCDDIPGQGGPASLFSISHTGRKTPVRIDFTQARNANHPSDSLYWTGCVTNQTQTKKKKKKSVPQRIIFNGIQPNNQTGNTHSLVFRTEAVKHQNLDRHGYDFLISWEQAKTAAGDIGNSNVNELLDLLAQACNGGISANALVACQNNSYVGYANIPDVMGNPPNHHGISNVNAAVQCFEGIYGDRNVEIDGNAAISNATLHFEGYTGSMTGDNYAWYTLTWTSASTDIVVKVAAHAAVGFGYCGYGSCWGAGHINGAPYHFILETLDGDALGRRDNQTMVDYLDCNLNIPITFGTATATDNCTANQQTVIVTSDSTAAAGNNAIKHCRRWTATDDCGNMSQCIQCVTVDCGSPIANDGGNAGRDMANAHVQDGVMVNAYPNPFKSTVTIEFSSDIDAHSVIEIYTVAGERVATLLNKNTEAGVTYKQEFNAKGLAEGIYVYRIINGDNVINGKLTLMK